MFDYVTIAAATLIGMIIVMSLAWAVAQARHNAGWIDVFWTFGAGATLSAAALAVGGAICPTRQWLVGGVAILWSLRLGLYMATRVLSSPHEDSRYTRFRKEWGEDFAARLYRFSLLQALAAVPLALAVAACARGGEETLGWRDFWGVAIFLLGWLGEAVADEQMRRFKKRGAPGDVMDRGLWAWSRHPNYVCEWLVWLAYPIIGLVLMRPDTVLTLLGPMIMYLVLRYGTGAPMLERSMIERRGEGFRDYQRRVPIFFPWPPGWTSRK